MASATEMSAGVRQLVRDFPQYFEVDEGPLEVLTIRLPHPLISSQSLQVYVTDVGIDPPTTALTKAWQLDERNGLLKVTDESYIGKRLLVAGYHYLWFSDSDVARAVHDVALEFLYTTPGKEPEDLSDVEVEVASIGAVVRLLWSLVLELSLDIDVSTPEGMYIPAHQRYQQAQSMLQYWENEYETRAQSLNVGLGALEIFQLRRVSRMTGRFVPVYRDREIDDPRPPERLYPPIPYGVPPGQVETAGEIEVFLSE